MAFLLPEFLCEVLFVGHRVTIVAGGGEEVAPRPNWVFNPLSLGEM